MVVYEHDDQGLRVIGYNHGIFFYDPNRTLVCELYLRSDGVLASNCAIVGSVGAGSAPTEFVRLDGNNWASWIPTGGTQSVVGSFNLQGAAYQYKISGRHALSMPGTNNLLAGDGAGAALTTGTDNVLLGYNAGAALTNTNYTVQIGANVLSKSTADNSYAVLIGWSIGDSIVTGDLMDSVVIGWEAVYDTPTDMIVNDCVLIGDQVLNTIGASGFATKSIVVGANAIYEGVSTNEDVIIGYSAASAGSYAGEYTVAVGAYTGAELTTGNKNTLVGFGSGVALTTGASNVFLGFQSGYYETGSNKLFIDNAKRTNEADGRVKALIYGVFDAATANQYLTVNGHLTVLEDAIVGGTTAAARLHVDQSASDGAAPVLLLDQADVSEEFVRFVGTAASATLTQSIVNVTDVSTATVAGYVKVYVQDDGNQITDQAYYMPIYTLA